MGSTSSAASGTGFAPSETHSLATFGAGCFWGVEHSFKKKFGSDVALLVGYAGGASEQPSYRQVCTGTTNHAEVLQVQFDEKKIRYTDLLDFLFVDPYTSFSFYLLPMSLTQLISHSFRMHDPTTKNRQGGDAGTQYRSAIFYSTPEHQKLAEAAVRDLQHHFGTNQISTTIEPLTVFWNAEEYHQKYLDKNPNGYECPTHFERSWDRIHEIFGGK
ncbi:Peptide-methionine (S)-S-oxide reductase [Thoreauomyces humboldtii]|nr:Peptide-methionine (S)-S-oxide reductase [Thoreauomyces humboldtii]